MGDHGLEKTMEVVDELMGDHNFEKEVMLGDCILGTLVVMDVVTDGYLLENCAVEMSHEFPLEYFGNFEIGYDLYSRGCCCNAMFSR